MTNPDVVSLEVAKALRLGGWPQIADAQQEAVWWVVTKGGPQLCHATVAVCAQGVGRETYAAPTIGQMLAYCARRRWDVSLEQWPDGRIKAKIGEQPSSRADAPADALGLALCEALKGAGR